MANGPQTRFFLSSNGRPLEKGARLWNAPIPLDRTSGTNPENTPPFSYGDYFETSRLFLENQDWRILTDAATRRSGKTASQEAIRSIDIFLEKHGPFYHPARVLLRTDTNRIPLVLNVAVSDAGLNRIDEEYRFIKKLNETTPWRYLPQVDSLGCRAVQGSGRIVKLFLGEWIEKYHEFHICGCTPEGKTDISVWKGPKERLRLPQDLVPALYREAAKILTAYYDLHTFDQIFPWHHAAGDFIVRVQKGIQEERLDLKLVSVRRYAPTIHPVQSGLKSMFEALLIFLLNLSMRMRLDRIEGVGDTVWADDRAVRSTLQGFFDGMAMKHSYDSLSEPLSVLFKSYLLSCSESGLSEVCEAIVGKYSPDESGFVRKRLHDHIAVVHREIRAYFHPRAPSPPAKLPRPGQRQPSVKPSDMRSSI